MDNKYRGSFIAISFGVLITVIIAVVNHGGIAAMKTGKFWGEIAYVLLLAGILTGILYVFMSYRKKEQAKKEAKEASQGNRAVKRSKGKGKVGKRKGKSRK